MYGECGVDQNDQRNSNLEKSYKRVDTCHLSTGGSCQCKKQTNKKKNQTYKMWYSFLPVVYSVAPFLHITVKNQEIML